MYVPERIWAISLAALASLLTPAHAEHLQAPALLVDPPPAPTTQYVRDLLVIDAAAALKEEADKAGHDRYWTMPHSAYPVPSAATARHDKDETHVASPQRSVMRLKAILGVGSRLSALVDVQGRELVYRSGRAAPVSGPDTGLRLIKITVPCAEFVLDSGHPDTLCIHEAPQ